MKNVRVYWDAEVGWTVDVPFALVRPQLEAIVAWTLRVQRQRLIGRPREVREQMQRALRKLSADTLRQNLVPVAGEGLLYTE